MGVNHFSGSRGSHVDGQRFPALRFVRELRDEICEPRPSRWECSPFITGSALGESSVPQNLGVGQKECPTATPGGRGDGDGIPEETICKVAYQFGRNLLCNDDRKISTGLGTTLNPRREAGKRFGSDGEADPDSSTLARQHGGDATTKDLPEALSAPISDSDS